MSDKPEFLKSSGSSEKKPDPAPNRPQKSGSTNQPDGGSDKFPNRPQPDGCPKGNPQSIPSGGKLPYKGAPADPGKPFKLGS